MKPIITIVVSLISTITIAKANISANIEIISVTMVSGNELAAGTNNNTVILKWAAKNETSGTHYEIERSFYSNNFSTIATLQIPFISNSTVQNYSISDNASAFTNRTIVYYRVKQVNVDGHVSYSNTTVVKLTDGKNIATNAMVSNHIQVRFNSAENGNAVIRIAGHTGEIAASINAIASKGSNSIELNKLTGLSKGIYITEISVNGIALDNQKIIIE
jgi:hypothetical protein